MTVWGIWKKPSLGLLIGYSFLILSETVLIRKPFVGEHIKLELFWSWKQWSVQKNQILTNVVMFVPVGVLVGRIWRWRGVLVAIGLSVLIEVLQFMSQRGLCEIDDVIHNCLGAAVGICVSLIIKTYLFEWRKL